MVRLNERRDRVKGSLRRLVTADVGQDLLEYAMLVALISLVAVGAISALGQTVQTVFWNGIVAQW